MTSLVHIFSVIFLSLSVVFLLLIFNNNGLEIKHKKQIEDVTLLTRLPGVSLSSSFLEARIFYYEDYSNNFYLNMKTYRYSDFIYVK